MGDMPFEGAVPRKAFINRSIVAARNRWNYRRCGRSGSVLVPRCSLTGKKLPLACLSGMDTKIAACLTNHGISASPKIHELEIQKVRLGLLLHTGL